MFRKWPLPQPRSKKLIRYSLLAKPLTPCPSCILKCFRGLGSRVVSGPYDDQSVKSDDPRRFPGSCTHDRPVSSSGCFVADDPRMEVGTLEANTRPPERRKPNPASCRISALLRHLAYPSCIMHHASWSATTSSNNHEHHSISRTGPGAAGSPHVITTCLLMPYAVHWPVEQAINLSCIIDSSLFPTLSTQALVPSAVGCIPEERFA